MVEADQGHGTSEARQVSWSPGSRLPEALTLCHPSRSSLRKITHKPAKDVQAALTFYSVCEYVVILCSF